MGDFRRKIPLSFSTLSTLLIARVLGHSLSLSAVPTSPLHSRHGVARKKMSKLHKKPFLLEPRPTPKPVRENMFLDLSLRTKSHFMSRTMFISALSSLNFLNEYINP